MVRCQAAASMTALRLLVFVVLLGLDSVAIAAASGTRRPAAAQ
jgi:hypothetical protein